MYEQNMKKAMKLALRASKNGDVPVGAVIVKNGKIISSAYNKKHKKSNALYHAEILAINKACKKLKNFRLDNCEIVVTKEPCLMCMGAILSARIKHVVFGAYDKKYGNISLCENNSFNHTCTYTGGVLEKPNSQLLTSFFETLRSEKRRKKQNEKV